GLVDRDGAKVVRPVGKLTQRHAPAAGPEGLAVETALEARDVRGGWGRFVRPRDREEDARAGEAADEWRADPRLAGRQLDRILGLNGQIAQSREIQRRGGDVRIPRARGPRAGPIGCEP